MEFWELPDCVFKTDRDFWFKKIRNYTYNDLGFSIHYSERFHGQIVSTHKEFPALFENEPFNVFKHDRLTNLQFLNLITPFSNILFKTIQGFRFVVRMNNYKFEIQFKFNTTDPRFPVGTSSWHSPGSGQLIRHLLENDLRLTFKGNLPVLMMDSWDKTSPIEVPSSASQSN